MYCSIPMPHSEFRFPNSTRRPAISSHHRPSQSIIRQPRVGVQHPLGPVHFTSRMSEMQLSQNSLWILPVQVPSYSHDILLMGLVEESIKLLLVPMPVTFCMLLVRKLVR